VSSCRTPQRIPRASGSAEAPCPSEYRVRNFAEAVFYARRDSGYGSMSRHPVTWGAVLRTIRLQLAKDNFTEEAVISRE
jgi:hypothetical protein